MVQAGREQGAERDAEGRTWRGPKLDEVQGAVGSEPGEAGRADTALPPPPPPPKKILGQKKRGRAYFFFGPK